MWLIPRIIIHYVDIVDNSYQLPSNQVVGWTSYLAFMNVILVSELYSKYLKDRDYFAILHSITGTGGARVKFLENRVYPWYCGDEVV